VGKVQSPGVNVGNVNDNRRLFPAKGNRPPDERERLGVKDAANVRGMKVVATARGVKAERRKGIARVASRRAVVFVLPPAPVILHRPARA